jgi:hypothetical protein
MTETGIPNRKVTANYLYAAALAGDKTALRSLVTMVEDLVDENTELHGQLDAARTCKPTPAYTNVYDEDGGRLGEMRDK